MTEREREEERLEALLRSSVKGFDPGFADRVMRRLEAETAEQNDLSLTMRVQFRRLAPIGLAASLALAAFNLLHGGEGTGQSRLEALLGLEPVTLDAAYSIAIPTMTETERNDES